MKIEDIRNYGVSAKGKEKLIGYYEGKQLPLKASIEAKCYECMNGYSDGKVDCVMPSCPLYPFMPYREGERRVMKKMTDEQKAKISQNLLGKKDLSQELTTPAS